MKPAVVLTLWILALGAASGIADTPGSGTNAAPSALDLSDCRLLPVYTNDFSRPQNIVREEDLIGRDAGSQWKRLSRPSDDAEWIAEGLGAVRIRDGALCVSPVASDAPDAPRSHMVVWNRTVFPEDFLLELDMDPCGSTNGLTILLFAATARDGGDIFATNLPPRRGDYKAYHSGALANYTDAYWSRNNEQERTTNRLRRNPGMNLLASVPSLTAGPSDLPVHLRLLKRRNRIAVEINGRCILACEDPAKPLGAGRIGLRSMDGVTQVRYDNFRVWRVENASAR
jgi:hypothetical protein